jgi:hypothetical protein
MNTEFLKHDIEDISILLIKQVFERAYNAGHSSYAPLGCSGDDYFLYGTSRRKEISLRLHSGDVKMLITDNCGQFLFYGGFDASLLPISFICEQYFNIIQNVRHLLDNEKRNERITEEDKEAMFKSAKNIIGFVRYQ